MPKILIGISILLLTLSVLFGFLNTSKVKGLRSELVTTTSARENADRSRLADVINVRVGKGEDEVEEKGERDKREDDQERGSEEDSKKESSFACVGHLIETAE